MVLFFKKELLPSWCIHHQEEATSTQDLAIAAAQSGAPSHQAYLATRQTAGRGRQDRAWEGRPGNLHLSILLRPDTLAPEPAFWSLMAGLAVQNAAANVLPGVPVLKWPNDVLLDGGKFAGVLIDSALTPAGTCDWVVIGIGANLAHAPALPGRRTACLAEHGVHLTPFTFTETLLAEFDHWAAHALPTIRAAWLARAHPIGTPLRVQQASQVIEGAFDGLAPNGALLLRGHPPITTGEITMEAPHAAGR